MNPKKKTPKPKEPEAAPTEEPEEIEEPTDEAPAEATQEIEELEELQEEEEVEPVVEFNLPPEPLGAPFLVWDGQDLIPCTTAHQAATLYSEAAVRGEKTCVYARKHTNLDPA